MTRFYVLGLGRVFLTIIIIAIPILTACSFCLEWSVGVEWLLTLLTVGECIGVYWEICERSEGNEI